ncbi:MAG TPA: tRNA (adenosine(37)-N6)-threonylcarbamoyltransferase complex dimerization subunit type 1 TsaB [Bacteroidales bacterium]|nr:tRNA (adenosine(37)-N6)-threonylcarbamoyltransferase complex dimerization subunit type 1 TsaB [Bacteroidales bacterium]
MAHLLLIETSTKVCSVGISHQGNLISLEEDHSANYGHAGKLTLMIEHTMKQAGISFEKLSGVAVSKGPGSFTGLRIGVSAAKGICFGKDLPLIALDTLQAMALHCLQLKSKELPESAQGEKPLLLCPMIDARRMEVYCALFDQKATPLSPIQALVVEQNTFLSFLENKRMVFFGDGAAKCSEVIAHSNAIVFGDVFPSARGMASLAYEKYSVRSFESLAYFEPYYLKDFVAGKPKVKGLYG